MMVFVVKTHDTKVPVPEADVARALRESGIPVIDISSQITMDEWIPRRRFIPVIGLTGYINTEYVKEVKIEKHSDSSSKLIIWTMNDDEEYVEEYSDARWRFICDSLY